MADTAIMVGGLGEIVLEEKPLYMGRSLSSEGWSEASYVGLLELRTLLADTLAQKLKYNLCQIHTGVHDH